MEKQNRKTVIILTILVTLSAILLVDNIVNYSRYHSFNIKKDSAVSNEKINYLWKLIDRHYVDRLDADSVADKMYAAMLSTLDPHSRYLSAKDLQTEEESLRGNFEGVGIVLRIVNDTVYAGQVIPGGPADQAGVLAGDRIITVDGTTVSGVKMDNDKVVSLLRGRRNSKAKISVIRYPHKDPLEIMIVRNVIDMPSVTYSGMIDKTTGYIRIANFGGQTDEEFRQAVRKLKKEGMKRMVLDLRGNGGGLLSAAINICDELLPKRELIVYTEGAHQRRKEMKSRPGGLFAEGPLMVMIDEYSASASEIVAGAVQDNDRGVIVGRRSFGKGLVQQEFEIGDGSAIWLTVARYYTPSGRCIQRPYDKGTDEYYADFLQQVNNDYLSDTLLIQITDSTPYYTSQGRVVYGGGGIYPDHNISFFTDTNLIYYNQLVNKALFQNLALDLVSKNGVAIKKQYPSATDFIQKYQIGDDLMERLFREGEREGIARNNRSISCYRNEMRTYLKAQIGEMLYDNETFYAIILSTDHEIQQALKHFNKDK